MGNILLRGFVALASATAFAGGHQQEDGKYDDGDSGVETIAQAAARRADRGLGYKQNECIGLMDQFMEQYCSSVDVLDRTTNKGPLAEGAGFRRMIRDLDKFGSGFHRAKLGVRGLGARILNRVNFLKPGENGEIYKFGGCEKPHITAQQFCSSPTLKHNIYNITQQFEHIDDRIMKAFDRAKKPENKATLADLHDLIGRMKEQASIIDVERAYGIRKEYDRPLAKVKRGFDFLGQKIRHPLTKYDASERKLDLNFSDPENVYAQKAAQRSARGNRTLDLFGTRRRAEARRHNIDNYLSSEDGEDSGEQFSSGSSKVAQPKIAQPIEQPKVVTDTSKVTEQPKIVTPKVDPAPQPKVVVTEPSPKLEQPKVDPTPQIQTQLPATKVIDSSKGINSAPQTQREPATQSQPQVLPAPQAQAQEYKWTQSEMDIIHRWEESLKKSQRSSSL